MNLNLIRRCCTIALLLVFLELLHPSPILTVTHPDDILALRHLKHAFHASSITPGSCLASWNFSLDPCDHIFTDHFTCGLRCDLILFGFYRVTDIFLDQAGYSGSLSSAAFSMPYLQTLDLSYNSLSGSIPASISNLTLLRRLALSVNFFNGSIPSSIASLSRLQELCLDNNRFSGLIPATLNRLVSLNRLQLQHNELTGDFPDLSQLRNLYYLDLSDNRMSGKVPEILPRLLIEISLRNNSLQGHFRILVSKLRFLQVLDLSYNQLTGKIPSSLFEHPSLQQLTISHNNFTFLLAPPQNAVPRSSLVAVDFSYNEVHGSLPEFMAAMPKLSAVSLEHNKFTGIIPEQYAVKAATASFRRLLLGGNYLVGPIPVQFLGLNPGSVNVSLVDNCLYFCPVSFYFCRGGSQKSWADCNSFGLTMP